MRTTTASLALVLIAGLLATRPAAAINSQALGIVEPLPIQIHQIFHCGHWSESGREGYYRIVLVDVSGGVGTEVYIQPIQETVTDSNLNLKLLQTTPVRELNDDHGQYLVSSARCVKKEGRSSVELVATFEHDEDNVVHHIRIHFTRPGSYRISNTVVHTR